MTENEAKYYLNDMSVALYAGSEKSKAIKVAINALEKQIAKKPYLESTGMLGAKLWHCPVCKAEVISDWNKDLAGDYCHICGQKLDWQ